tara:strand:+ start:75 stop:788 length:714 start_codon:yes stop_codon:yes gene_type:complete
MKLILENWRKYLKEADTRTAPAKKGAISRAGQRRGVLDRRLSVPAELLPTLFDVFIGDPETFSIIHDKYDLADLKNKDFEEVKHDKKYDELTDQMLYEPIKTLQAIGHYGNIKKEHFEDFLNFVLKLPEEEKVHVLTALAIYSDKWTKADIIGLLAFEAEQIKLYGCLFHKRSVGSRVSPSDYHYCRGACASKCEAEEQECLDRGEHSDFCAKKKKECEDACKKEDKKTSWTHTQGD